MDFHVASGARHLKIPVAVHEEKGKSTPWNSEDVSTERSKVKVLEPELPLELIIRGYPVSHQTKRKNALERWKENVHEQARDQMGEMHFALERLLIATVYIFPRAPLEPDLDNATKPVLDGLSKCVYMDDKLIERLTIQRFEPGRAIAINDDAPRLEEAITSSEPIIYIRLEGFEEEEG